MGRAALLMDAAELSTSDRVLEIGSGPGWDAAMLRDLGLETLATDGTPAFVEHLRDVGFPSAEHYDVVVDRPPTGPWSLIFANAVLLHVPRELLPKVLQRLLAETKAGGHLLATFKTGRQDGWSAHKLNDPRWFTYWSRVDLERVLAEAGWAVRDIQGHAGQDDDWLVAHAQHLPGSKGWVSDTG